MTLANPNTPYSSGSWPLGAGVGTHTENYAASPDGNTDAWIHADTDATAVYSIGQNQTVTADTNNYTFYMFLRKDVVANKPGLFIFLGAQNFCCVYDTVAGTAMPLGGGVGYDTPASYGIVTAGPGAYANWWLCWIVVTNTGLTTYNTQIAPAVATTLNGAYSIAASGSAVWWSDSIGFVAGTGPGLQPVASFTYSPQVGPYPLSVTFTNTSTGTPTSYLWVFGDGNTSTDTDPTNNYAADGTYTVTLTAHNTYGTSTATATVTVIGAVSPSPWSALTLGARSIASLSSSSFTVSCADTRRLVQYTRTAGQWGMAGDSGDLGAEPGKIISFSSKLWTITSDGYLRRFTNASTPVNDLSVNIHADTNAWITSASIILVAPIRAGGLALFNSSGVELFRMEGVLPRIRWAVTYFPVGSDAFYIYCFGDNGAGAILSYNPTSGQFLAEGTFTAKNTGGIIDGYVTGTTLVAAVSQLGSVVTFDLTDPTAPVLDTTTRYGGTIYNVLNDSDMTPLTAEIQDLLALPKWCPATAGRVLSGGATVIAHGRNGRLQVT